MYRWTPLAPRRPLADALLISLLTWAVLLVHGYHPWAEDGGLYAAGIEYLLRPELFPKYTAFVTEHLRFSLYAPLVTSLVRLTHLSLAWVLFCLYLGSIGLTLVSALRLARCCFRERVAQWTAVGLLAAWWTMPVAGTSLLLMDPYLTARSFSTPLSLLALSFALRLPRSRDGRAHTPALLCVLCLLLAAALHPLMAAYAICLVVVIRLRGTRNSGRVFLLLTGILVFGLALWQGLSQAESPAVVAACLSRYYWFLSRWQWYEWLGLLGPTLIFAAILRWRKNRVSTAAFLLCVSGLQTAVVATLIALLFAQEHFHAHPVARLQPLRAFLLPYALMIVLLGGLLPDFVRLFLAKRGHAHLSSLLIIPVACLCAAASPMWWAQRASFPASPHVEWPGRVNPNLWVQAFLWVRANTPEDALFALDSRYVNTEGEDAQTFRAIALRSEVPDFSKDGGEAAITPSLAPAWLQASNATRHLDDLSDLRRLQMLKALGVQWLILRTNTPSDLPCRYANAVVKVCMLKR